MKRNKWTKIASLILAVCLLMTLIPTAYAAEEVSENETVDFVLLIDYSNTMDANDREGLAVEACKMFLDLIPVEDARVSIIAFGYEGKEPFEYANYTVSKGRDHFYVHEISKMEGQLASDKKDTIKVSLDNLSGSDGQKTTIGAALAAGMDTLMRNNATQGNAYIIMLSDGYFTSTENAVNNALTDQALQTAKEKEWPIYCIEMDYQGWNEKGTISDIYDGKEARQLLDRIVVESGAGSEGRMRVSNADQIAAYFLQIFAKIWDHNGENDVIQKTLNEKGEVSVDFKIGKLVSEATIAITSDSVDKVHLVGPNGFDRQFSSSQDEKNLIVTKEGSYMCIKLICPSYGDWNITVYGDPNAEIVMYMGDLKEMNLALVANATSAADNLTKADTITVQALYTYNDNKVTDELVYQETVDSAKVIVTYDNGYETSFPMQAGKDGYTCKIPCVELPSGGFKVRVDVVNSMFRSGSTSSNDSQHFKLGNLPLQYVGGDINQTGYVNGKFDQIDLTKIFSNPDGDKVTYAIACTSDRNFNFEHTIDENGYLDIQTGMVPGTYQMQVSATDGEMSAPLTHDFTLTVEDRPVEVAPIPAQELWVDYYDFLWLKQDPTNTELHIDLGNYFSDPDGVELVYGGLNVDTAGLVQADLTDGILNVLPVAEGEMVISFTVNDGVSTIASQVSVETVSGKAIYWKTYGIFYAIALAVLIVILFVIWVIVKNKRVKGTWDITFDENGMEYLVPDVDIASHTTCGRKKSFFMHQLVDELAPFLDNIGPTLVMNYFNGTGADKIQLGGVYGKKGCVVLKVPTSKDIPDGCEVSVSVNGIPVTKTGKMASGKIVIDIGNDMGSHLTIRMSLH